VRVDLIKTYTFEAAHSSPKEDAPQSRVHGHSYVVELLVSGEVDSELGWLMDYSDISDRFAPLQDLLDHRYLDDVAGLEVPTLHGIQKWIYERLAPDLPGLAAVHVCIAGDCAFRPCEVPRNTAYDLPAALRFTFEAAHYLPAVPVTHKCRRLHGHSFRVDVAADDLDALRPHLEDIYGALSYRCLNDVRGIDNPTSEQVSKWIWDFLAPRTEDLRAVTVAETCTARCIYRGE